MKPRVVLLAGGKTADKHLDDNERLLTRINGQPLLTRTVHQFGTFADICVVTGDPRVADSVRAQKGIFFHWIEDHPDPHYKSIDMIRKGLMLAHSPRDIIVFGDVVFSDEAVATIRDNVVDEWAVYGRSSASEILGTPYAEYFAIEVGWGSRGKGQDAVEQVVEFRRTGQWHRATAWEWYREMEGMDYAINNTAHVRVGPHWVEINDTTDDIDFVEDITRLRRHYE